MTKEKSKISILGSGWLGLPLAEHLVQAGYDVKASTRSEDRLSAIEACDANGFIVDTEKLPDNIQDFLDSTILIINITSKNINAFESLIQEIESSPVKNVLFVSSMSVYKNLNRVVSEDENAEDNSNILFQIEQLFCNNSKFTTTVLRFAGLIGYQRHPGRWFASKPVAQAETPVNLIHRDDCVSIIDNIIELSIWGEVLNASADTHPSRREFYTRARSLLNLDPPKFTNDQQPVYKVVSNEKLKRVLEYDFIHPDIMAINF